MSDKLRVMIVDDQRLMREGLRTLLELETDMEVVGEAEDGLVALERYPALQPDVILMDVRMPRVDGVEATRQLCVRWPQARVLILTTFAEDAYVLEGIRAGALGYLLKDVSGQELAVAVRTVAAGGVLLSPAVARKVLDEVSRQPAPRPPVTELTEPLSEREQAVLKLVAEGLSNAEIATSLHLAEGTVKNYITSILQKMGVRDRTQAALYARSRGLI